MSERVWYEVEHLVPGEVLSPPKKDSEWWELPTLLPILTKREAMLRAQRWSDEASRPVRVIRVTQTRTEVEL